jgi:hypothetical protein
MSSQVKIFPVLKFFFSNPKVQKIVVSKIKRMGEKVIEDTLDFFKKVLK